MWLETAGTSRLPVFFDEEFEIQIISGERAIIYTSTTQAVHDALLILRTAIYY
jgi:hypothetical protein